LPQVRATNSGISAFITPTGEIIREVQTGQREGVLMTIPPTEPVSTLMVAWGDWFGPTALIAGLFLLVTQVLLWMRNKASRQQA
jgi:apolipoprotein N-acyltransferase